VLSSLKDERFECHSASKARTLDCFMGRVGVAWISRFRSLRRLSGPGKILPGFARGVGTSKSGVKAL